MKECPYCKTENHEDATVCRGCGKEISKLGMVSDNLKTFGEGMQGCGCLITIVGAVVLVIMFMLFSK